MSVERRESNNSNALFFIERENQPNTDLIQQKKDHQEIYNILLHQDNLLFVKQCYQVMMHLDETHQEQQQTNARLEEVNRRRCIPMSLSPEEKPFYSLHSEMSLSQLQAYMTSQEQQEQEEQQSLHREMEIEMEDMDESLETYNDEETMLKMSKQSSHQRVPPSEMTLNLNLYNSHLNNPPMNYSVMNNDSNLT